METFPPLCLFVVVLILGFVLGLVVFNHVATIKEEKRADNGDYEVAMREKRGEGVIRF